MNRFFFEFEVQLLEAVRRDFQELVKLIKDEHLYAISLVTDSYFNSIYLAINTEEALLKQVSKYEKDMNLKSQEFTVYLKWTPAEWLYGNSKISDSKVKQISEMLQHKNFESTIEFEVKFYEVVANVLKVLDEENFFSVSTNRDKLTLFMSMSDDDKAINIENYSAKLLNPEEISNQFAKRFDK